MAVNRYPATCSVCNATVPANGGNMRKVGSRWEVRHLACGDGEARVVEFYSPVTGWRGTRNSRGLCIDAPACGCCTF